jgi:DNA-binding NarL/FixJ family response regulator
MSERIRVMLVDDQELIRLGFRMVLEAQDDLQVIGEAADGAQAIREAARLEPDVILMDVRMPNLDGIAATERIVAATPDTRIVILTTFDLDEYAFAALRAGASGFLLKDAQVSELVAAVRAAHRGDAALSPRVTRRLVDLVGDLPAEPAAPPALATLTGREREVFLAVARGRTNAEIAEELYLSESTVKTHVGRVLAKLDARDRVHAVILAHRWRLLAP